MSLLLGLTVALLAATPNLERHLLADGTELLVAPLPGSNEVSFRYVVHAGATAEPFELAGLAHLLEHLIFHGTPTLDGDLLFERAREGGAYVNAFTSWDHTRYVLDSPRLDPALLSAYVQMITNPAIGVARLDNEKGVVAAEADLRRREGIGWLIDQVLFPGIGGNRKIIGSVHTRSGIHDRDLQAFFRRFYTPANTTIIVAGDIEAAPIIALLEEASQLAPRVDDEPRTEEEASEPNIPSQSRIPAPFGATILGYLADGISEEECDALAGALHLRGTFAMVARRSLATSLEVLCFEQRGHQLLTMMISSSILDGPIAAAEAERLAKDLSSGGLSGQERALLQERKRRSIRALTESPATWADALVEEVVHQGPRGERKDLVATLLGTSIPGDNAVSRAASKVVTDDRRFFIQLTLPGL
jgi:zinc protease